MAGSMRPVIQLTCMNLTATPEELQTYRECLSADERRRAAAFATTVLSARYIAAHVALRILLGQTLNMPAQNIRFEAGLHGKPRLASPQNGRSLHFNLSHSADCALIGIANTEIGVDIERVQPLTDLDAIAAMVLTAEEREQFQTLEADDQMNWFYRCWVAKEACMKESGRGLALDPRNIRTFLCDGASVGIADDMRWHIQDVPVEAGYRACFAIRSRQRREEQIPMFREFSVSVRLSHSLSSCTPTSFLLMNSVRGRKPPAASCVLSAPSAFSAGRATWPD
jgi:phosphopantetheine--protein transferase-like protein